MAPVEPLLLAEHPLFRRDAAASLTPNDTQKWVERNDSGVTAHGHRVTLIVAGSYVVAIAICECFLPTPRAAELTTGSGESSTRSRLLYGR